MGTELGKHVDRLIADLEKHGPEYHVFQAIFLAEKASRQLHPDGRRKDDELDQTGLQFRPYEMYVYPPKDIRAFECKDGVMTFVLNFMGLYGINSPLPRCYHEQVALQQSVYGANEVPLQNFFDIFNNRFYWLYYLAWKKYRYYLQLNEETANRTTQRVFAFIGRGPETAKAQVIVRRFNLLQFSGILSNRHRNKAGLLIMLHEFFPRYKIQIEEFVPNWIKLAEVPSIGSKNGSSAARLGVNAVAGNSVLDYTSRICVEIGPMPFVDYLEFVPNAKNALLLHELLDLYLNDGLEYDVKIIIQSESIVSVAWNDRRLKLGTSLWLGKPKQETVQVHYKYEQYVGK